MKIKYLQKNVKIVIKIIKYLKNKLIFTKKKIYKYQKIVLNVDLLKNN